MPVIKILENFKNMVYVRVYGCCGWRKIADAVINEWICERISKLRTLMSLI